MVGLGGKSHRGPVGAAHTCGLVERPRGVPREADHSRAHRLVVHEQGGDRLSDAHLIDALLSGLESHTDACTHRDRRPRRANEQGAPRAGSSAGDCGASQRGRGGGGLGLLFISRFLGAGVTSPRCGMRAGWAARRGQRTVAGAWRRAGRRRAQGRLPGMGPLTFASEEAAHHRTGRWRGWSAWCCRRLRGVVCEHGSCW